MKTTLLSISGILFFVASVNAQSPQSFKYQAVLRDNSGLPLIEKNITIKINILEGSLTGLSTYSEVHQAKTSLVGVVNLEIGKGTQNTGNFTTISWGTNTHFVKIEIDPLGGGNFEQVGTSQLLSVPYALYAEKSGDEKWGIVNADISYLGGNVGIGTNNPSVKLDVMGANSAIHLNKAELKSSEIDGKGRIDLKGDFTDQSNSYLTSLNRIGDLSEDLIFGLQQPIGNTSSWNILESLGGAGLMVSSSGEQKPLLFGIDLLEKMRINGNGNVGIGITNPAYQLDVGGIVNATQFLQNGAPIMPQWTSNGNNLSYTVGNVGIGTNNPSVKLEVDGGGELNLFNLRNNNNSLGINAYVSSNTDFHGTAIIGRRSRGTSASPQPVAYNDRITGFYGSIFSDGDYQNSSAIQMYVGLNAGPGSYPSNIRFETTSPNQSSRTERLRVSETGNIIVKTGDIFMETIEAGVIMKSPNGNCWRMTVSNSGSPVFNTVTCPN